MIELDGIDVSYGNIQVIWDLDFQVTEDDGVVSIVGPNGAGKSTLLRVMSGLHPVDDGTVHVWGEDAATLSPSDIVRRGFVHVSEERNLFGDMTVRENLEMGAYTKRDDLEATMQEVFELFP
ncbi:branched-chain amino acid ABC transporter ATP-binding protein, partial [Haloferax sp. Atlit-6N]